MTSHDMSSLVTRESVLETAANSAESEFVYVRVDLDIQISHSLI